MKWVLRESMVLTKDRLQNTLGFPAFFFCVLSLTLALPEDLGEKYPLNLMVECERGKIG